MTRPFLTLFFAVLGAGAVLWLSGCGAAAKPPEKKGADERQYPVRTALVEVRPLEYKLESTGSLQAEDVYRIDAEVPGVVADVAFNEGDHVTAQKVLCRLSPRTYALNAQRMKAAWQKAKDAWQKALADVADTERKCRNDIQRATWKDVESAKVKLSQAQRDVERLAPAFKSGAVTEDQFLAVKDRFKLAEVDLELAKVELRDAQEALKTLVETMRTLAVQRESEAKQAEVEWQQAEEDLRKSSVVSPVAGVIDQRFVTNGTQVTPGAGLTPLAQVVSLGLKLKFTLPEQQVAVAGEKSRLTFRVSAYPGRDFGATIYYVSDLSDPKTRLVTCWARVDKTDAVLKSGFFAKIHIVTEKKDRAVVIPVTAALPTEKGFLAFVVEDGRARPRPVTLGLQVRDRDVEVKEGLKEGERIVTEGANALQDGVRVREQEAPKTGPAPAVAPAATTPAAPAAGAQEKSS